MIPVVNSLVHFLENTSTDKDEGVRTMKRKMLLSLNNRYATIETNKFYALPTLLDPRFKVWVFSSTSSVIQARQCLTAEFISFQSTIVEAAIQNNDPPAAKRHHKDHRPAQKQSSLWSSFESMIQTGDETDAALTESVCTAKYRLKVIWRSQINQDSQILLCTGKRRKYFILF